MVSLEDYWNMTLEESEAFVKVFNKITKERIAAQKRANQGR